MYSYNTAIANNIAAIRAARREAAPLRAQIAARKQAQRNIADFFVALAQFAQAELQKQATPDFSKLFTLTCGDYQKWLRRQIRQHGRRFEIGTAQNSPIDVFVKETTGFEFCLMAGGEVEVTVDSKTYEFMSDATTLAYYIYDDNGNFVTTAGKALDLALENASTLIIARV